MGCTTCRQALVRLTEAREFISSAIVAMERAGMPEAADDRYPEAGGGEATMAVQAMGSSEGLTCREREVLTLVARGLPNRNIARHLGIAEKTVKNHLATIFVKLGVSDRTQAALCAVRSGMTEL